jgi:hypothetical protein
MRRHPQPRLTSDSAEAGSRSAGQALVDNSDRPGRSADLQAQNWDLAQVLETGSDDPFRVGGLRLSHRSSDYRHPKLIPP